MEIQALEFRRHVDGLVYRFDRRSYDRFLRPDGAVQVVRHPEDGWIVTGVGSSEILSRPWHARPGEQGDLPPEGIWVSRKGSKSYVYDLVHIGPETQAATK